MFRHCRMRLAGLCVAFLIATSGLAHAQSQTPDPPAKTDGARSGNPHILYTANRYSRDDANQIDATAPGQANPTASMFYHNGPIMPAVAVYTIYWIPPGRSVAPTYQALINRYFQDIGGSDFYRIVTQYYQDPPRQYAQNNSHLGGTWVDTDPYPANGVNYDFVYDQDIRQEIQKAIVTNHWPNGGYNAMFFVFTASGVESCFDYDVACTPVVAKLFNQRGICAYHSWDGSDATPLLYANMPYDATPAWGSACAGMNRYPNDRDSDIEISTASHEHFEAVTDPIDSGWSDPDGGTGEIGDKCAYRYGTNRADGSNVTLNGHRYVVQQEWSNAAFNGSAFSGCALSYSSSKPKSTAGDFDGDGKSDMTVFRPSTDAWYTVQSRSGNGTLTTYGGAGDTPVAGDFDGDGKTDIAVFRPSTGVWYIVRSSTGAEVEFVALGAAGDIPIAGDFDGDGKADIAVYRPTTGAWYYYASSTGAFFAYTWGIPGDIPVPGDYDGDGKTDIAVYRPSTGVWFIVPSRTGNGFAVTWGASGDIPVAGGDYDGDGKTDIAVFRPSTGVWYILPSSTGNGFTYTWGVSGDVPIVGDYDGDGRTDIAVYRPSTGAWYIVPSTTGNGFGYTWGISGDIPILKRP
jgi:hypothetical protein